MTRRDALFLVPLSALGCNVRIGQERVGQQDQPEQPKQPEPQFTLDTGTLDVWGQKKTGPFRMAVSPNGKYLLTIAHAKTANVTVAWNKDYGFVLYDLATGEKKQEVRAGAESVNALAVKPDGSLLLTGSEDALIKGWALSADGVAG